MDAVLGDYIQLNLNTFYRLLIFSHYNLMRIFFKRTKTNFYGIQASNNYATEIGLNPLRDNLLWKNATKTE